MFRKLWLMALVIAAFADQALFATAKEKPSSAPKKQQEIVIPASQYSSEPVIPERESFGLANEEGPDLSWMPKVAARWDVGRDELKAQSEVLRGRIATWRESAEELRKQRESQIDEALAQNEMRLEETLKQLEEAAYKTFERLEKILDDMETTSVEAIDAETEKSDKRHENFVKDSRQAFRDKLKESAEAAKKLFSGDDADEQDSDDGEEDGGSEGKAEDSGIDLGTVVRIALAIFGVPVG